MLLMLPLWACTADAPASEEDPVVSEGPRHPDAVWTAEEVGAAVKGALEGGLPNPVVIAGTFQELLSHGDDRCPGGDFRRGGLEVFNPEGCLASSGYRYEGAAGGSDVVCSDSPDDSDEFVDRCAAALRGDAHITDPEGHSFLVGGYVAYELAGDPVAGGEISADLYGTWGYPAAPESWLAGELSMAMQVQARWTFDRIDQMQVTGGFSTTQATVDMRALSFDGACGDAPTGAVGIRGAEGYWYDLSFDPESCDHCGEVTFDHRESLGRACADLRPAVTELALQLWRATRESLDGGSPQ
ncbi:MAG TPA: hypothetical protein PLA94_31945 [Myxococcota bacterium]|nr:hypothetical protein [Myxococcota bacterium]